MAVILVNPYCTRDQLVHELKMKKVDVDADEETADTLHEAINNASRYIDDYQQRDYFQHNHASEALLFDETYDHSYEETIYLPYAPIITLGEVSIGGTILVLNTDFLVKTFKTGGLALVSKVGHWNLDRASRLLSVKGVFGYAQANSAAVPTGLPDTINLCARKVAAAFSGKNRKEVVGLQGDKMDVLSEEIPKIVREILGRKNSILI